MLLRDKLYIKLNYVIMWEKSFLSRLVTLWIETVLAKVLFIKIHDTVD